MKSSKKALAFALAAAMAITGVPVTDAGAATTAKLSATKATIYVGGSKTVSVSAPKSWKSVKISKVTTSKKSVATAKKTSTKKFKVTAVKAGTATVKVKVTYKKSAKKSAKTYSKTLSFKATVKNMSLSVSPASNTIMVDDTFRISASTAPSNAKVTYSVAEEDKDIVRVSTKGNVRGLKAGTATITVTASYGGKKVKKDIEVTVDNTVADGITATLKNAYSEDYSDVVVTNSEINKDGCAILKVTYGENQRPVTNEYVNIKYTYNNGKTYQTAHVQTDANGVAYFNIYPYTYTTGGVTYMELTKVKYTVSPESSEEAQKDPTLTKEGTFQFGHIGFQDVTVNTDKTKKVPSVNDYRVGIAGSPCTTSAGIYTKEYNGTGKETTRAQYTTEYVNSQQVGNAVTFKGGMPSMTLPGETTKYEPAKPFNQTVTLKSDEYATYAKNSQYFKLDVDPNELSYAYLNFASLKLSKYTKLVIEVYTNEDDAKKQGINTGVGTWKEVKTIVGPHDQKDFNVSLPLTDGKYPYVKLTLLSAGQVDANMNKGYEVTGVTGVYKEKKSVVNGDTKPLKNAKITWSAATTAYNEEVAFTSAEYSWLIQKAADGTISGSSIDTLSDLAAKKDIKKLTYSTPRFPHTGNAIIRAYDKNGVVIGYFACPTKNNGKNVNELDSDAKWIYRISEKEAAVASGVKVEQIDGENVTVTATEAGTTLLEGKVEGVEGLDAASSTIYTSVQWNPVADATAPNGAAIAFIGQTVELTAQLVDQYGNPVAKAGEPVKFDLGSDYPANSVVHYGDVVKNTDKDGKAKLTVNATTAAALVGVTAAPQNVAFRTVFKVNDENYTKLDQYWVDAAPSFTPSVLSYTENGKTVTTAALTAPVVTDQSFATVGDTWLYGFNAAPQTLVPAGVLSGQSVTTNNAKINVTSESDNDATVNDYAANGTKSVTASHNGTVTLSAIITESSYDASKPVTFTVGGKEYTNDGTGSASFTNDKQKLVTEWKQDGAKGTLVDSMGYKAATGSTIWVYFKAVDKMNNAISGASVKYQIDQGVVSTAAIAPATSTTQAAITTGGSVTNGNSHTETGSAITHKNGLVAIPVVQYNSAVKTIVTFTYEDVEYSATINWVDSTKVPDFTVSTEAGIKVNDPVSSENPRTSYAEGKKIVLTFNDNVLKSSVKLDQFKVTDVSGAALVVQSVDVSGKTITLNFNVDLNPTNKNTTFKVEINSKAVDGINYVVTSENGITVSDGKEYTVTTDRTH